MQLPQIRLQSRFVQIGLNIQQPKQEIEQPQAIQSIEQPQANMTMETTPGQLTIDQTKAREDLDLKNLSKRVEEFAQNGYQDWLSGLARRAEQGRELAAIENGGNPIAAQARQNSERPEKQFNIGWIPSYGSVKLNYEPGKVNIQVEQQRPVISAETRKPIHTYTPGKVTPEITQNNSLDIDFINLFPEKSE
ncbi:DUF6470 family protein [Actinomycetes bacterium NPDC127524]